MEINKKQLAEALIDIKNRINDALIILELDKKESELDLLESQSQNVNFWEDRENAQLVMKKANSLKEMILPWRRLEKEASELVEILESTNDQEMLKEVESNFKKIEKELKSKEIDTYFSGKYDDKNAVLSIYAGAGGIDAQDWVEMLLSMYLKYSENKNFKAKIISLSPGNEAGIKVFQLKSKVLGLLGI
jgi:peptide chain release factor 2